MYSILEIEGQPFVFFGSNPLAAVSIGRGGFQETSTFNVNFSELLSKLEQYTTNSTLTEACRKLINYFVKAFKGLVDELEVEIEFSFSVGFDTRLSCYVVSADSNFGLECKVKIK